MKYREDAILTICSDRARIRVITNKISQMRTLLQNLHPGRQTQKASLFDEICNEYENLSLPSGAFGRVAISIESNSEVRSCALIDEYLDQMASVDSKSALWDAKASMVLSQLQSFVQQQKQRLDLLLPAGDSNRKSAVTWPLQSMRSLLSKQISA